jgi:DNA-directed RNA polymerase specialized sigma24 family protein
MAEPSAELTQEKLLTAIVALLIDARAGTDREAAVKTELVLAAAGLTATEIAPLVGKQPSAVRMALSRARKGAR